MTRAICKLQSNVWRHFGKNTLEYWWVITFSKFGQTLFDICKTCGLHQPAFCCYLKQTGIMFQILINGSLKRHQQNIHFYTKLKRKQKPQTDILAWLKQLGCVLTTWVWFWVCLCSGARPSSRAFTDCRMANIFLEKFYNTKISCSGDHF